jgi:hypothetical protein
MIWPRCSEHCPVNGTRLGCSSHHRVNAIVHEAAREKSDNSWHASIMEQYTLPAMIGETSPAEIPTIASSSNARPSGTRPE